MQQFKIRLIRLGRVKRQGACAAVSLSEAEREVHQEMGVDVLAGEWAEITPVRQDKPERAEVIREAVESMKHPENIGAG